MHACTPYVCIHNFICDSSLFQQNFPQLQQPLCKQSAVRTHPFNGSLSGTTQVSRYQKGKTSPDFTEARDSEWQWHQLGNMQVCTSLQTNNHASTQPLSSAYNRIFTIFPVDCPAKSPFSLALSHNLCMRKYTPPPRACMQSETYSS